MLACVPLAVVFGILGIVLDRSKVVAIITTVLSVGLVLFYVSMIAISIASHR